MSALFDALRACSCIDAAQCLGIPLKRVTSTKAWALCPLHGETGHPSMMLTHDDGWYCFGCHAGGDAVRLYESYLGLDAIDAARQLAKDMGYDIDDSYQSDTIYVNPRHLRDALAERRKVLIKSVSEAYMDADDAIRRLEMRLGREKAMDDARFAKLLEQREKLEMKLELLQDASDEEMLQILEEAENGQKKDS